MNQNHRRWICCFTCLILLFLLLTTMNLYLGSISYSAAEITNVLLGKGDSAIASIVTGIRLPRIAAAAILGGALSVSGFLLQTFFANPIAGPFVLGVSSGAKLSVALVMILFLQNGIVLHSAAMIVSAFVGAMLSMGFVLIVSGRVQKSGMLIVSGIMIGYICSAITDFVVTFADDSNIVNLHNWSMGSFSGIDTDDVKTMSVVIFTAFLIVFALSKQISAYQLGETYARSVGMNIRLFRVLLILLSSILSACVTAFAGPVSFVGIAVPHLIKTLFKTAKPIIIIPAVFLGGGVFCLFCDLIARTLFAPTELSISSVTAVFGAPVVICMMLRRSRKGSAS